MRIVVLYAQSQHTLAERLASLLAVRHEAHLVTNGEEGKKRIEEAEYAVVLVSDDLLAPESEGARLLYDLQARFKRPSGHVLPILVDAIENVALPPYLASVTYFRPRSVAAQVTDVVRGHVRERERRRRVVRLAAAGFVLALGAFVLGSIAWRWLHPDLATKEGERAAESALGSVAQKRGYDGVRVAMSFVIEPGSQPTIHDIPIVRVVAGLREASASAPQGDPLIGLFAMPGGDAAPPVMTISVQLQNAFKQMGTPFLMSMAVPMSATDLEPTDRPAMTRLLRMGLSFAPYLQSIPEADARWACERFQLPPPEPGAPPGPPILRTLTLSAPGCPERPFHVFGAPASVPFPPIAVPEPPPETDSPLDQVRATMFLPKRLAGEPYASADSLRVTVSPIMPSVKPALLAIVWARKGGS